MKRLFSIILILVLTLSSTIFATEIEDTSSIQRLAFPTAEGGGMYVSGAMGAKSPEIYHVTNLNDSGSGSFRDAVSQGNRFIIFDIGGNIKLTKPLSIKTSNLTILGQTAPGDGISIEGNYTYISGSNIILRYLRFRLGAPVEADSLTIIGGENIIIDHCSTSWSVDECCTFYAVKNFTLQWSIIAESMNSSAHVKGNHGYGGIWGGINSTAHHNLISTHNNRNPMIGTGATVSSFQNTPDTDSLIDIRNNVIYNWGGISAGYGATNGIRANFINNYYRPGPATSTAAQKFFFRLIGTTNDSPSLPQNGGTTGAGKGIAGWSGAVYVNGNYMEGDENTSKDNTLGLRIHNTVGIWDGAYKICDEISDGFYIDGVLKSNDEFIYDYPVITQNAQGAYTEVLKYAGASNKRDAIDERIVNNVINKTAPSGSRGSVGLIDSQDDVGGFLTFLNGEKPADIDNDGIADFWEDENGLDKNNSKDCLTIANDGYTMLEKYCETLTAPNGEVSADKSKLNKAIYSAIKIKKDGYTKDSWESLQNTIQHAQNASGIVYALQSDIDNALNELNTAISALETDPKYYLGYYLEQANSLNSDEYTSNSYKQLSDAVPLANEVFSNLNATQAEIDDCTNTLRTLLNNLKSNYRYKLSKVNDKVKGLNQLNYSVEKFREIIAEIPISEDLLSNSEIADDDELLYIQYNKINDMLKLNYEPDHTRLTGDFEDMLCFPVGTGNYGNYSLADNANKFEIKTDICGNSTKAFVLNDTHTSRTSFKYNLPEKNYGVIMLEGDFCFVDAPKAESIFFRIFDSAVTDINSNGQLADFSVRPTNTGTHLYYRNYRNAETAISTINTINFASGKWYNIKLTLDSNTGKMNFYVDNTLIYSNTLISDIPIALTSYIIATPGSNTQIMAIDNLSHKMLTSALEISDYTIDGEWQSGAEININCEISNFKSTANKLKLIVASFESGVLTDAKLTDVVFSEKEIAKNTVSTIKLGEDIENCEVKIFLWDENLSPMIEEISVESQVLR